MLLISVNRAAAALKVPCPPGAPTDGKNMPELLEALRSLTPRVASALEVATLERGTYTDTFRTTDKMGGRGLSLSNGFLLPGAPVTFTGLLYTEGSMVDRLSGTVYLPKGAEVDPEAGAVTVTYTSGFAVPEDAGDADAVHADPNYRVAIDVPDALAGIVADLLVNYQRNQLQTPAAPSEYGFLPTLNLAVQRDLSARINGWYLRPRHMMNFPLFGAKNGA